tara:strand:- start:296 stop:556 length:261 start_codon:yes stop_codon:yes gene_type:complete
MPRYKFACTGCAVQVIVSRSLSDSNDIGCEECGEPMKKALTVPHINAQTRPEHTHVGEVTEQFIEDSRVALEKQKEDVKEINYEPS